MIKEGKILNKPIVRVSIVLHGILLNKKFIKISGDYSVPLNLKGKVIDNFKNLINDGIKKRFI